MSNSHNSLKKQLCKVNSHVVVLIHFKSTLRVYCSSAYDKVERYSDMCFAIIYLLTSLIMYSKFIWSNFV